MKTERKVLYFEGAGWSGADISKATVGNCRIRTAFHLDDGRKVYLEIIACEVTKSSPKAQQGRDFVKALRLRSYSLTPAAPIWGGAWVLWYNDPRYRRKIH